MALKNFRRFIGCELKESYFKSAVRNLSKAEMERSQTSLFNFVEDEQADMVAA